MATEGVTNGSNVLNPDSLTANIDELSKTRSGLIDGVGLFGSTHVQATWRNELIETLSPDGITIFNPQLPPTIQWEAKHAEPEADALVNFSVIVFRLENHALLDGSLGSIGEIGMAMTSAFLRGQRVVVSIEDGFGDSLTTKESVNQFAILQNWLERLHESQTPILQIHQGNDLKELSTQLKDTVKKQQNEPLAQCEGAQRHVKAIESVVVGGTSGGATVEGKTRVSVYRAQLMEKIRKSNLTEDNIHNLSAQEYGNAYRALYKDGVAVDASLREKALKLQKDEIEEKWSADLAAWPVIADGVSMGAVAETGMLMFNRLITGRRMVLLMEAYDPRTYIWEKIIDQKDSLREAFQSASKTSIFDAILGRTSELSYKELRNAVSDIPALQDEFMIADSANRVRNLARAHLERIVKFQREAFESGKLSDELFYVAKDRSDFEDKVVGILPKDLR